MDTLQGYRSRLRETAISIGCDVDIFRRVRALQPIHRLSTLNMLLNLDVSTPDES